MSLPVLAFAPLAVGFLLTLFRCVSLFAVAPVFGTDSVPATIKMSVALPVSFAVFTGAGSPAFAAWQSMPALVTAALCETLLGLAAGAGARFAIEAAYAAGQLASQGMGLGFGSILDPFEGADSTAIAQLFGMLALGAVLAVGGPREIVVWLSRSTLQMPDARHLDVARLSMHVVTSALGGISMAVRLAYPVLSAVLVGQVAMGLLGRVAPQLSLGALGFSVTILCGGGIVYIVAPSVAEVVARETIRALGR